MSEQGDICFVCHSEGSVFFPAVGFRTSCPYCKGKGYTAAKKKPPKSLPRKSPQSCDLGPLFAEDESILEPKGERV